MSHSGAQRSRVPRPVVLIAVALALALSFLAGVQAAYAGEWAQVSCSYGGAPAPTEGWAYEALGVYPVGLFGAADTCQQPGGALRAYDEAANDPTPESGAMWVYTAPAGSTIAGGTIAFSMLSPGGQAYLATPANNTTAEDKLVTCTEICTAPLASTVTIFHTGGTQLFAVAQCTAPSGPCPEDHPNSEVNITAATIVLSSQAKPTGTEFAGSLLGNPTSGKAGLTFTARDPDGPGIYRASVTIDGQTVWSQTPNANGGECAAHGTYEGALVFLNAQPCLQETGVNVEVDTTKLSEGEHQLSVALEDAAGNNAIVYTGAIHVDNKPVVQSTPTGLAQQPRGPANGTPASERATLSAAWELPKGRRSLASRLASRYGLSHLVLGRLVTPSGAPIAGALVEVSQTPAYLGASAVAVTSVRTGTDGSFTAKLPADLTSSTITLSYRSHLGDPSPAATAELALSVPARLRLTVKPRVTRVGATIVLTGRLSGSIPPGGKLVVFEAREAHGRWIEFHTAVVHSNGVVRVKHRFVYPGPARYEFRILCRAEAGFPFTAAFSNTVYVRER